MPENLAKPTIVRLTSELEKENSFNMVNHCSCAVEETPSSGEEKVKRRTGCVNQVSVIKDWLYLSGARAIRQARLRELGITCVVNCTAELPTVPLDGVEFVKIHVSDTPASNLEVHLDAIADKIEEVRGRGGRVLVHCVAGVSRSPAFVLAYLIKYLNMSLRQAFFHVRSVRPNVRPNAGFFSQLIEFERRLRGCTSVSLVHDATLSLTIPDVCEDELKVVRDTRWAKMIHERRNFERLYA